MQIHKSLILGLLLLVPSTGCGLFYTPGYGTVSAPPAYATPPTYAYPVQQPMIAAPAPVAVQQPQPVMTYPVAAQPTMIAQPAVMQAGYYSNVQGNACSCTPNPCCQQ